MPSLLYRMPVGIAGAISRPQDLTTESVIGHFQQIYGTDAYLDPDSKDGQMVALVALAIHDANNTAIFPAQLRCRCM